MILLQEDRYKFKDDYKDLIILFNNKYYWFQPGSIINNFAVITPYYIHEHSDNITQL